MIEVRSVSKSYRGKAAVSDVSFTAPTGMVTGFVGPNGAGKSTVLKTVSGLLVADSGDSLIDGHAFTQAPWPAQTLGVFLTAEWLPSKMTPRALLSYVCRTQCYPLSRVDELLELVGLTQVANERIRTFSLGMRQRLGIAAAVVAEPRTMIFDEPANGLDPDGIQWFRAFIASRAAAGATVLLSSHHMSELALVSDRIVMIRDGRIVANGPVKEFIEEASGTEVYVKTAQCDQTIRLLNEHGIKARQQDDGILVFGTEPHEVARIVVDAGHALQHLSRNTRTLEESYFVKLSERSDT